MLNAVAIRHVLTAIITVEFHDWLTLLYLAQIVNINLTDPA